MRRHLVTWLLHLSFLHGLLALDFVELIIGILHVHKPTNVSLLRRGRRQALVGLTRAAHDISMLLEDTDSTRWQVVTDLLLVQHDINTWDVRCKHWLILDVYLAS